MKLNNKTSISILVLVLLGLSYLLYSTTIHFFPSFIHAWTQSDRYAIAVRFVEKGFDIFHPSTFNLQTVEGITRVDFPINEFLVALIMKVVGVSPTVFRFYTLMISIIGMVYLFLLGKRITSSDIKSALLVLFVFLAPVYTYYQAGFIPSIPSLTAVFAAYYYYFTYRESGIQKQFNRAILFFLLAALMRFPFVIFLVAVVAQQFWLMLKKRTLVRKELYTIAGAFLLFTGYYLYNVHLGKLYGNMFLDTLMPARSWSEFKEILKEIYHHWFFEYFTLAHYITMFVVLGVCTFYFFKRKGLDAAHKKYWFHAFIISCGTFLYFLMMARQYYSHDYYFLDSLFVPTVLVFLFALNEIDLQSFKQKLIWSVVFLVGVVFFFIGSSNVQEERYVTGPWDRTEITRQNFIGTDQFLSSMGVSKDAKILVIDAYTTNVPLILMDREGYTVLGTTAKNIATSLAWCKWDYVAIQDIYLISDVIKGYPYITSMIERVGGNGKVSFYKRSNKIQTKSLKQFLGISPASTQFHSLIRSKDTESKTLAKLDAATEYGLTAVVKAAQLKNQSNLKLLVSSDIQFVSDIQDIQLVVAVSSGTEQIYYQNFDLKGYFKQSPLMQKMEFQFVLPEFKTQEDELKVYFWNPSKREMVYDNWEVTIYK